MGSWSMAWTVAGPGGQKTDNVDVPAPSGWDPAGFWITTLTLSGFALFMATGPREVVPVDDDGKRYPPVLDFGTTAVRSAGMMVEAGVQVGAPAAKCLRLRIPLPPGRAWTVARLRERRLGPWLTGVPAPRAFRLAYRCSDPDRLSAEARAALLDLRADAVDLWLEPDALTVRVLRPTARNDTVLTG
jgi:hypothetical protein